MSVDNVSKFQGVSEIESKSVESHQNCMKFLKAPLNNRYEAIAQILFELKFGEMSVGRSISSYVSQYVSEYMQSLAYCY